VYEFSALNLSPTLGRSLPFGIGGGGPVHLEPTDSWATTALAVGADDIAQESSLGSCFGSTTADDGSADWLAIGPPSRRSLRLVGGYRRLLPRQRK